MSRRVASLQDKYIPLCQFWHLKRQLQFGNQNKLSNRGRTVRSDRQKWFYWVLQKFTRNANYHFFFQVQLLQILSFNLCVLDLGNYIQPSNLSSALENWCPYQFYATWEQGYKNRYNFIVTIIIRV